MDDIGNGVVMQHAAVELFTIKFDHINNVYHSQKINRNKKAQEPTILHPLSHLKNIYAKRQVNKIKFKLDNERFKNLKFK